MQIEVKTYKYDSRNLMIANTRDKSCTVSEVRGDKEKALAALAYTIALVGTETKFVLPPAFYNAVGRNPHTDVSILVARPDKTNPSSYAEILRLDPRKPVELQEDLRGQIVEALAEAIGLMFLPEARSNQPEPAPPEPTYKPDTSIKPAGPRFGLPLHTAESIAATIERPAGKASSRSKASA